MFRSDFEIVKITFVMFKITSKHIYSPSFTLRALDYIILYEICLLNVFFSLFLFQPNSSTMDGLVEVRYLMSFLNKS